MQFWWDPSERDRDLERVTKDYNLLQEGVDRYLGWRNSRTVSNFFYTSHMVEDYYITLLQDLNKRAVLHQPAPNPLVYTPSGDQVALLSLASPGVPLVVNFGSCT